MTTISNPPARIEQRVLLSDVSWSLYEHLLAEQVNVAGPRFAYDRGELEIMVNSFEHEELNRLVHDLVTMIALERDIEFINAGSTTFKREDLLRGFEPDTSFYFERASRVAQRKRIDLTVDPPPDLVIEIDITHPSLDKFPIFAGLGVPEVWRCDGARLQIFVLQDAEYVERAESGALPGVTGEVLTRFVAISRTTKRAAWLREVRAWAQRQASS